MCHVPHFADATLHFGSRTGQIVKKVLPPVLLGLEDMHITTTLGLGVGILSKETKSFLCHHMK